MLSSAHFLYHRWWGGFDARQYATGAWTFRDSPGTEETNPSCTRCGLCDCESFDPERGACADQGDESCEGLSEAFLSDKEVLCLDCAKQAGIRIVPCDCE